MLFVLGLADKKNSGSGETQSFYFFEGWQIEEKSQSVHAAGTRAHIRLRPSERCDLIRCDLAFYQVIHFQSLIPRNGRKLIQKLIDAHANTQKIIECFDADTSSAKNRRSILDFGVYADRGERAHPTLLFKE